MVELNDVLNEMNPKIKDNPDKAILTDLSFELFKQVCLHFPITHET